MFLVEKHDTTSQSIMADKLKIWDNENALLSNSSMPCLKLGPNVFTASFLINGSANGDELS